MVTTHTLKKYIFFFFFGFKRQDRSKHSLTIGCSPLATGRQGGKEAGSHSRAAAHHSPLNVALTCSHFHG